MKPTDALRSTSLSHEFKPDISVEPSLNTLSAQVLFSGTLANLAHRQNLVEERGTLCWLMLMSRQLGLTDQEALDLSHPYPKLHQLIALQIKQQSVLTDAQRAEFQDDLDTAITCYEQHLETSPYDQEARLKLARILLSHGERKRVKHLYQDALKLHEGPCIIAIKAELLISYRHFDEAYLSATEAWELAPTHPEILITLSKTQHWALNHEAERDSLDRALQTHAHHPLAQALFLSADDPSWLPHLRLNDVSREFIQRPTRHMHLALIQALLNTHKYDLALTESRRLLQRDPKNIDAQITLVQSLTYLGHTDEAREILDLVFSKDGRHPVGLFLKCFLSFLAHDNYREDALDLLKSLSLRSSKVALLYSQVLRLNGQRKEAHQICLNIHRKYSKRSAPLQAYCQSLIELGEYELVEELCLDRLDYYPQDIPIKLSFIEVLLLKGRHQEALEVINELLPHPKAQEFMVKIAFDTGDSELVFTRSLELLRDRPCSADLIEYAVNATLELDDLEGNLAKLYELITISHLYPNQAVLFLQLQLIIGNTSEAKIILDNLSDRPVSSFSDERLLSLCESAKRLQDSENLKYWTEKGLERTPDHPRLSFLHAVSLWWTAEHDQAVRELINLQEHSSISEEELVTLTIWLCELKRGLEARPFLDQLYQMPSYLQGVIDVDGNDIIKARVLLFSAVESDQIYAQNILLAWLHQVQEYQKDETTSQEHSYDEILDRVVSWLIDAQRYEFTNFIIEQELSKDTSTSHVWLLALKLYQELGDLDRALYALNHLAHLDALNDRLLLDRAEILEQLGHSAQALAAYHEAYQAIPDSYEVRLERALALVRAQHLPAAEQELLELLKIASAEDLEGPLEILLDRGLPSLVEVHFDHPGEAQPSPHAATSEIGPICEHVLFLWLSQVFEHSHLEEASQLVDRLEIAYGQSHYLKGFQGLIKLWGGQISEALPLLRIGSTRDLYFALEYVRALWESGLKQFSVAVLQECVFKSPQDLEYLKLLVERLIELEDAHSAHHYLLALSCLDPEEAENLSPKLYESLIAH